MSHGFMHPSLNAMALSPTWAPTMAPSWSSSFSPSNTLTSLFAPSTSSMFAPTSTWAPTISPSLTSLFAPSTSSTFAPVDNSTTATTLAPQFTNLGSTFNNSPAVQTFGNIAPGSSFNVTQNINYGAGTGVGAGASGVVIPGAGGGGGSSILGGGGGGISLGDIGAITSPSGASILLNGGLGGGSGLPGSLDSLLGLGGSPTLASFPMVGQPTLAGFPSVGGFPGGIPGSMGIGQTVTDEFGLIDDGSMNAMAGLMAQMMQMMTGLLSSTGLLGGGGLNSLFGQQSIEEQLIAGLLGGQGGLGGLLQEIIEEELVINGRGDLIGQGPIEEIIDEIINGGGTGRVWGDPHFNGAEGDDFDVMGSDGGVYNILSDKDFQFNAEFGNWGDREGQTIISTAGFTVRDPETGEVDQVEYTGEGELIINGETISENGTYRLANGSTVTLRDGSATFDDEEYTVTLTAQFNDVPYLDHDITIKEGGAALDGVLPHGLWGQTADGDGEARLGDKGIGAQGGGAIETIDEDGNVVISERGDRTAVNHYRVDDLFDTTGTNFTNKFNFRPNPRSRNVRVNAGARGVVN